MTRVLVTGATGTLGSALTRTLRDSGVDVRAMSRRERDGSEWVVADLTSNVGVDAAVGDVDTIVHCATQPTGRADIEATRNLIAAAKRAGAPHLVYVSIVGVDEIPLLYYRVKREVEDLVATADLPWTTLRATQFHDLALIMFTVQRWSPILLAPSIALQPIDVRDVAARLTEIVAAPAAGRVPDIGGPEVHELPDLGRAYLRAYGRRRRVVPLTLPGRTFAAYRAGHNLAPTNPVGTITFDDFLAARR